MSGTDLIERMKNAVESSAAFQIALQWMAY